MVTDKQVRELWEVCGCSGNILAYLFNTTLSLDNLFKHAVPKVIDKIMAEYECSSDFAYASLFKRWLVELELDIPNADTALFKVVYKVLVEAIPRPKIICLCGSTRFIDTFNEWQKRLTYEGKIVLSIEIVNSQAVDTDPQHCNSILKDMLDELHLRKIDLADEVLVLNVGGYIGESTTREIAYACKIGKPIKYLVELE